MKYNVLLQELHRLSLANDSGDKELVKLILRDVFRMISDEKRSLAINVRLHRERKKNEN